MRIDAERTTGGVPASIMAALMLTVFMVSVGYGVVLPNVSRSERFPAKSLTCPFLKETLCSSIF